MLISITEMNYFHNNYIISRPSQHVVPLDKSGLLPPHIFSTYPHTKHLPWSSSLPPLHQLWSSLQRPPLPLWPWKIPSLVHPCWMLRVVLMLAVMLGWSRERLYLSVVLCVSFCVCYKSREVNAAILSRTETHDVEIGGSSGCVCACKRERRRSRSNRMGCRETETAGCCSTFMAFCSYAPPPPPLIQKAH